MTIDEAIAQLKDLRKDRESFLANDEPDSEFAKDIEAIDVAVKALEENFKLKRLLRLAVEDLSGIDGVCDDYDDVCDECPCKVNILGSCKWKHAEEALKLIGDDKQ